MHQAAGTDHLSPINLPYALVTKADAKQWQPRTELPDHITTDPRLVRRAGSGRNTDPLGIQRSDFIQRDLVVPPHERFDPQLAEILDEVVGKRVVVIYDEKHRDGSMSESSLRRQVIIFGGLSERERGRPACYVSLVICDFSCIWASLGQSIGMAKKKKAQVLETKGVTISKEPSTVKGNRYSSYRITCYKEGRRCRERFRTEAAAQTRAQEVRKKLESPGVTCSTCRRGFISPPRPSPRMSRTSRPPRWTNGWPR